MKTFIFKNQYSYIFILFQMFNFIEHLTSKRYVIGLWCYDIAPYNIQTFRSVK